MEQRDHLRSPWVTWDITKWKKLYEGISPKTYRKKNYIFHQGDLSDKLYIVASGRVRIAYSSTDGGEKHLYIAEKGCLFCESTLFSDERFSFSAMAIVDCEIYEIPKTQLITILQNDWDTSLEFFRFSSRKNLMFLDQITDLSFSQSIERIGKTLLNLCDQYGVEDEAGGTRIDIRFTHQDVARIVATTRVTVSNVFNYFIDEGVLSRTTSYFVVKDMEKLKNIIDAQEKLTL